MANYSFQDPNDIQDGAIINSGNFTQLVPNTEIMQGLNLTINGGNFTNVKKQPEWTVNGGNWTQVDRCSHLHPEWIERGLDECTTECEHLVDTDEIYIDGMLMDKIYHYEDLKL